MEQLQGQVLYHDTDSIIYVYDEDNPQHVKIPLEDCLGGFTNELDEEDYIVEFIATAGKSYAFKTNQGYEKCILKGFTLNSKNQQIINFQAMKEIVFGIKQEIKIEGNKITRVIE